MRMAIIKITKGKHQEYRKGNPYMFLMEIQIYSVIMENNLEVHQKIQNRTTIPSRNPTFGYTAKGQEVSMLKGYLQSDRNSKK
jgi:hypothetical protein